MKTHERNAMLGGMAGGAAAIATISHATGGGRGEIATALVGGAFYGGAMHADAGPALTYGLPIGFMATAFGMDIMAGRGLGLTATMAAGIVTAFAGAKLANT